MPVQYFETVLIERTNCNKQQEVVSPNSKTAHIFPKILQPQHKIYI